MNRKGQVEMTQADTKEKSGRIDAETKEAGNGFRKTETQRKSLKDLLLTPSKDISFTLKSLSLAGLLSGFGYWACFCSLPVVYQGQGVIIVPQEAIALQSRSSGQVIDVNIKVGDLVKKGQLVARLDLPQLHQQIRQVENNIQELSSQRATVVAIQNQRTENTIRQIEKQRLTLETNLKDLKQLDDLYTEKTKAYQQLVKEGVIAPLSVYITSLDFSLQSNRVQIANISPQLVDLVVREREIRLQDQQANNQRDNQIDNLKRQKKVLETQLVEDSKVLSRYTGRVLDLSINVGQFVNPGTRLGTIDQSDVKHPPTRAITFFTVGAAKRIFPGMEIEITPDIDYRRRFGGIVSQVSSVAQLPSTPADISQITGNDQLAQKLVAQKAVLRVDSVLEQDPYTFSGFKWTISNGPKIPIRQNTTTQVWITVEKRTPIDWVIPGIRKLTGIYRPIN